MQLSVVQNKIYEIQGQKIMLDFDLAEMYEVETRVLKQSVKRNIERFPKDFMFELKRKEYNFLRSQIMTLENAKGRVDILNTFLLLLRNKALQCSPAFLKVKRLYR